MGLPITNATLNLTRACNLTCEYCFSHHGNRLKRMTFETAKKCVNFILKEASEANINQLMSRFRSVDIGFWGGEPLLEWELMKQIILYAENCDESKDVIVTFSSTTNGTLLTEDKFDFLNEHQLAFLVSIDGTQETHNYYRKFRNGHGSHAIIMENMEKILKRWPFYAVRTSPYAEGIHRFYDDIKFLVDHKMYNIMFSPVFESDWTDERWQIFEEQCMKVVDLIAEKRKKGLMLSIGKFQEFAQQIGARPKYPCGAGRHYVGFDTEGEIFLCHRFSKFDDERPWQEKEGCIGHVDVGITKPGIRNKLLDFHPVGCEDCKIPQSFCAGGCPAVNYDLTGEVNTHSQLICRYEEMLKRVGTYFKETVIEKTTTPQQVMNELTSLRERVSLLEKEKTHV